MKKIAYMLTLMAALVMPLTGWARPAPGTMAAGR